MFIVFCFLLREFLVVCEGRRCLCFRFEVRIAGFGEVKWFVYSFSVRRWLVWVEVRVFCFLSVWDLGV